VSQAEYDEKVAALALTEQELLQARTQVAALQEAEKGNEAVVDEIESAILDALGLQAISGPPPANRVEQLAAAVAATTEERDALLETIESGGEGEFSAPLDRERLQVLLRIAEVTQNWLLPSSRPLDSVELESLRPLVEQAGDEMVTLAYASLVADYESADADEQIRLLAEVGFWAITLARASISG
jgi:hypothetical protein